MTKHYLLNLLSTYCNFREEITEENFEQNIILPLIPHLKFTYDYGATKITIIPAETAYVIKIPFSGYYTNHIYYPHVIDYCKAEMDIYRKSKKDNYSKFFLPLAQMGKVNGYPIYCQAKAEIEEYSRSEWRKCANNYYGKKIIEDFHSYCNNNRIIDLSVGNIGYHYGRPVIIDYGGYILNEEETTL